MQIHPGGKGANQAVAAVRAGAKVDLIASISRDDYGNQAFARLRHEGIGVQSIHRPREGNSGLALILIDAQGQNLISVARSSNDSLTAQIVREGLRRLKGSDVLVLQLEIPQVAVTAALTSAAGVGSITVLNPAPARPLSVALLKKVHTLIPNESELALLTAQRVNSAASIESAAKGLLRTGIKQVIVTCGSRGVCWVRSDLTLWMPAAKVRAIDTTGAGDCFTGAFAAAIAAGLPTREAIEFAVRAAGISVTRSGAQPSMPTIQEILGL